MDAGWFPDPTGRAQLRWWDGTSWTEHVSTDGQVSTAPLTPVDAAMQEQQPAAHDIPQRAAAPAQGIGRGDAGITGDLISGSHAEVSGSGPTKQNEKMLRVGLGEPFFARQGAMVAYQGELDFAYQGGGVGRFLKSQVTGEGLSLMRVSGRGDVFLANEQAEVHILHLEDSGISINGRNVLAFSETLQWSIERVQGAGIMTGGLFNTTLRGSGWVAVTTAGPPVVLNAAEAPTYADTNAVVAWSASLQTTLKSTFKAGALIGRGSGEAVQVAFAGHGFVIVQPSEGVAVTSSS
ncbi:AIM24 family protein [Microbacterium sp. JZ31]|uniref:AIM24 family protein n=1 Tax=Microbacterium sp. JZ31 TaxID=1906274 RepID=UPI00193247E5|nr:AIM24 family protein [Microbacterium sp. JZ31]